MSRYIDVTELSKHISDFKRAVNSFNSDYLIGYISALSVVEGMIANTPTADVVEVVRCKDCKKWEQYENTSGAGYCHNKKYCLTYGTMLERKFTPITNPDDFCSYGERKEDGT